ncbi:TetR/AcrR family transcriptional regulator [Nocardia sp. NPDC088792]|uniref:TetR/AcrR family transcriptional regulator n=1 Tax=Nocardia sp. NPDC088792 TaxID=3364332 RepID=UPI003815A2E6
MTEPEIRRRTGGRSARVRAAVLDATLTALADNGFDQLNIAEVAARSGVHETTIYRRWKTREQLMFDALLEHSWQQLPIPDTGALRSDLITFARSMDEMVKTPLGAALSRAWTASPDNPALDESRDRFWRDRLRAASAMIDRAIARGELTAAADHQLILETVTAPVHFRALFTRQVIDEDYLERLVDLLLKGLLSQ